MAIKNTPHKIIVALKLPKAVADFIIRASAIHDAMSKSSTTYPSPPVAMPVFAAHIADLVAKQVTVQTRTAGAAADRDAARKLVVTDLGQQQGYVQRLVNADPANAESLAQDAGMSLRKVAPYAKPPLVAKPAFAGAMRLIAKATKGGRAYDWQYSADGGRTWVSVPSCTSANTVISGLQVGALLSFRHRAITKDGPQDWGHPVSATVT